MPCCAVFGCSNKPGRLINNPIQHDFMSFHRFPKNEPIRSTWIFNLRRKKFLPSSTSVICSEHFHEDDYRTDANYKSTPRLKSDAVPTIFPLHTKSFQSLVKLKAKKISNLKKLKEKKKQEKDRKEKEDKEKRKLTKKIHSASLKLVVGDHNYCLPSADKLKKRLDFCCDRLIKNHKEKMYKTKIAFRLKRENKSLKNEIEKLKLDSLNCNSNVLSVGNFKDMDLVEQMNLRNVKRKETLTHSSLEYSKEMCEFALKLNSISSDAYEFVRESFNFTLPHSKTLRRARKETLKEFQPQETNNCLISLSNDFLMDSYLF